VADAHTAAETEALPLLDRPVKAVVPPSMAPKLGKMGIVKVRDLLFHFPRRYDDFSRPLTLGQLRQGAPEGPVSAVVTITELRVDPGFRRRVQRTVARLKDATGEGEAVWFGRRYIERRLAAGDVVALAGKVELKGWVPRFANPEFGPAGDDALHAGRIVPVYRLTKGVTAPWLRARIKSALDQALGTQLEYLPEQLRREIDPALPGIQNAIEWLHFPPDFDKLDRALQRLALDELLALQIGMVARKRRRATERAEPIRVSAERYDAAIAAIEGAIAQQVARRRGVESVALHLTVDQVAALADVRTDMAGDRPMMRLLQGDVGSGKTAVAALALAFAADAGHQGALLAPTDLLARQHAQTLQRLLEPLGHDVTLLTGSLPAAQRREAVDLLGAPVPAGTAGRSRGLVVVGTHALVQEAVSFNDLRLAVVDEQHRFGVAERAALTTKGHAPHVLLMTATPIPRTLGQIVHADLDVSDLKTPPEGRQQIRTGIRSTSQLLWRNEERTEPGALPLLAKEIAAGHRAFVVVPLVEEDPDAARSVEQGRDLVLTNWQQAAAVAGVDMPAPSVEIVHGQMKASERDERMERFRSGDAQIVVGTTVLEVGVDVPEATVMLVLDADRFGLAQLHQLRGRVGRGEAQSYCVLVSERYPADPDNPATDEEATVAARLGALVATSDGFALAEMDLEQRREGKLLGLSQSGLPPFRVARPGRPEHRQLSVRAREIAEKIVDDQGRMATPYAALEHEVTDGWLRRVGAGEVLTQDVDA
jgi:ATP-dependent DNA helicase RecG